jgi:transcriptional regulator with XRE-family HTH domain
VKTKERQQARELRAQGCSVKEIERRLRVARSSVSRWVRDVPLEDGQRRVLAARVTEGPRRAGERKSEAARGVRRQFQEEGRCLARERDRSYASGCMLYWAEGDKRRNTVALANSDPKLLSFFAFFLRRHFAVREDKFRVYCNLFADHAAHQREIEDFWLATLDLSPACLRKSTVNTYSKYSEKKRTNKLPYGTCKLVVHSTKIVQTIYGSIQEYAGFDRPEWLD